MVNMIFTGRDIKLKELNFVQNNGFLKFKKFITKTKIIQAHFYVLIFLVI